MIAGCDVAQEERCAEYGQALGTAFQIIDDVLDYEGQVEELGKNVGDDLREGKATLPLILAMRMGTPEQATLVREAIENGSVERLHDVVAVVRNTGALDAAREAAAAEAQRAIDAMATLPVNAWSDALRELAGQLQHRKT